MSGLFDESDALSLIPDCDLGMTQIVNVPSHLGHICMKAFVMRLRRYILPQLLNRPTFRVLHHLEEYGP